MAKRVLMVDDSKTTRSMVSFTLRRAGYDVVEAEDGGKALALLGNHAVDCVITDLNMPDMDGLELIRRLRAMATYQKTPIVMLTTQGDDEKKYAGQRAGVTDWLNKPFHPANLLEIVIRLA
jgi:two-component system chemotaxis response regulator CheY